MTPFTPPEKKEEMAPLKLSAVSVSPDGVLTLKFNRPVKLSKKFLEKIVNFKRRLQESETLTEEEENFILQLLTKAFKIEYVPKNSQYVSALANYRVVSFDGGTKLDIKLEFTDPVYVSYDDENKKVSTKDRIIISITDPAIFVDPMLETELEVGDIEINDIEVPKQLEQSTTGVMTATTATTSTLTEVSMPASLMLLLVAGKDLNEFWRALNLLQFIPYVADWAVSMPSNIFITFQTTGFIPRLGWL
jgi:hypothetical protein